MSRTMSTFGAVSAGSSITRNLWNYLKELYGLSGVAETVNVDHIKHLYHQPVPTGIVASGPDIDFTESHDRDRLTGTPPAGASE